jgi:hypothetical protein
MFMALFDICSVLQWKKQIDCAAETLYSYNEGGTLYLQGYGPQILALSPYSQPIAHSK